MKTTLNLIAALLLSAGGFAQAGTLDNTFGNAGKVITSLGTFSEGGNAVALQNDGKIVVGGYKHNSFISSDFAVLRYDTDGALDNSFGTGGVVTTFVESGSEAHALAIQSDGKIVLGGYSSWYMNLVRYRADGSLDTTFGNGGKVITDVQGYYGEQCRAVSILNNGKILLGGYAKHNGNDDPYFLLARYWDTGVIDSTFGTDGVVIGSVGKANAMVIQPDGKILLGGATSFTFSLARFNEDGTPDTTFGTGGSIITSIGTSAEGQAMALGGNGQVLLAGYSYGTGSGAMFTLAQYNSDGSLDNSFGSGGIVTTPVGTSSAIPYTIHIQTVGKILLGGKADPGTGSDGFALVRYHTDGTPDNSFGNGGKVITPMSNGYSAGNSLAVQSDGNIILCGHAYNGSSTDIAIARYLADINSEVSVIDHNRQVFTLSPNPAHGATTIAFSYPVHNAEIHIYNSVGQEVMHVTDVTGLDMPLYFGGLPAGIYCLQLRIDNEIMQVEKLLIHER